MVLCRLLHWLATHLLLAHLLLTYLLLTHLLLRHMLLWDLVSVRLLVLHFYAGRAIGALVLNQCRWWGGHRLGSVWLRRTEVGLGLGVWAKYWVRMSARWAGMVQCCRSMDDDGGRRDGQRCSEGCAAIRERGETYSCWIMPGAPCWPGCSWYGGEGPERREISHWTPGCKVNCAKCLPVGAAISTIVLNVVGSSYHCRSECAPHRTRISALLEVLALG